MRPRHAAPFAVLAVAAAYAGGGVAGARGEAARHATTPALYWSHAPKASAQLSVLAGRKLSFTLQASARSRRERIHLSVLGWAPVDLDVKDGNPAKARVTFDTTRMRAGSLAVTFVASTSHRVSITRTIVVTVRPRATRLSGAARTRWAFVLEEARARSAPHRTARVMMTLPTATPDQTPNLVVVLAKQAVKGRVWVKVRLASLPNSRTAWVPRATLSTFRVVRTRLVVDTERMRIALYSRGARIFEAAIGVGRDSAPTPRGTFYVRERLTDFRNPFYGPVAFGTSARSTTLTDWPGGGFVGIHGTNSPGLIPGRISHGCIRLRNDDIIRLAKLLPLGTPVTVR